MTYVNPKLVKLAVAHCEATPFERYAQTMLGAVIGHTFKPLGGYKDGGADGFVDADILEDVSKPTVFFQASMEIEIENKITRTVHRLREVGRKPRTLYYASSRQVGFIDKLEVELSDTLDCNIRIYDGVFFEQHANCNDDVKAAFAQYLEPAIAFLNDLAAPSFPSGDTLKNARIVSAFLGQEVERRMGTAKILESVCDSLILWALEDTNPDTNTLMSEADVVSKVEGIVPSAKRFFRGQVHHRLKALSSKTHGMKLINIYAQKGRYCLPFQSRKILEAHKIEDEALKQAVTSEFQNRIMQSGGKGFGTNLIKTIVAVLHQTLETVFERQGFEAARHFLDNEAAGTSVLDNRTIIDIADQHLREAGISKGKQVDVIEVVKSVLRGTFYTSSPDERAYCARLARTYILLFTIRNTPEIIEYFNNMSKNFCLYVGSDLIIRAISEYYLRPEDQMTGNAFKIIRQAGSRLILTEAMLEEVHSHIHASHREYENVYRDIDHLMNRALASQSDRILIRSYYYAKFETENSGRPRSWVQYLNNFVTAEKLTGATSSMTMRSLRDTLCYRLGFEYEARDEIWRGINKNEAEKLSAKIAEMRPSTKNQLLADNDAQMVLRVDAIRNEKENRVGNPYGYKTWYLTQDTISNAACAVCFPTRRGIRYVMRPEFLINYIAYNPTNEQVKESLRTIFPSVLGVRLGSRLDPHTLESVLRSIKRAHESDPARASAIVAEYADALKSDQVRELAFKYATQV